MTQFKFARIAAASFLLAGLLAGVAAHAADFSKRTIRMSTGVGKDHPLGVGMAKMAQCLNDRSGGQMRLRNYFDSSLGNDSQASQQVRTGSLEMVLTSTAPLVGAVPQLAVFDLPFLFNNSQEVDQVVDGKVGTSFAPHFAKANLENLGFWEYGFRNVTNSKHPVAKWEDLQGLKMRVMQNKVYIDTFAAMGSNAVPLAFSEVYSALETKAIDGQENPVSAIDNMKFNEVQKYLSLTRHSYSPVVVLYSKKLFDQLSKPEQQALHDCAIVGRDESRRIGRAEETQTLAKLKSEGMQINEVSPVEVQRMRDRLKSVYDSQVQAIGNETTQAVFSELHRIRGQ